MAPPTPHPWRSKNIFIILLDWAIFKKKILDQIRRLSVFRGGHLGPPETWTSPASEVVYPSSSALSVGLIQGLVRPTHVSTRPAHGLSSPVQDILKPNNALACQLMALSGQQSAPSCQYRAFQVNKWFSHGDVEPSQGNTGPSQADGMPSWTKEWTSWIRT